MRCQPVSALSSKRLLATSTSSSVSSSSSSSPAGASCFLSLAHDCAAWSSVVVALPCHLVVELRTRFTTPILSFFTPKIDPPNRCRH